MSKMKLSKRLMFFLWTVFLLVPSQYILTGTDSASKRDAAKEAAPIRDFGFGLMQIFEFKDGTSGLQITDINNDGMDDILFLNGKISRLEVLVRKQNTIGNELPALEEVFTNMGFVLDHRVVAYHTGDLDGDNFPELVFMDNLVGIRIYKNQSGGAFAKPVVIHVKNPDSLRDLEITDLNNDGRLDLLLTRPENASILFNNGNGDFKEETTLDFSSYGCSGSIFADANNDGKRDLLFYFPKEKLPVRLRLGNGDGAFGWEHSLDFPAVRFVKKMSLVSGEGNQLAAILKNGLTLRLYGFDFSNEGTLKDRSEAIPVRLPIKGLSRKYDPSWVAADLDGDGYDDFCVTSPRLSQIHLYKGTESGLSPVPNTIDTLKGVKTIGITDNKDLVVFSPEEKSIALHKSGALSAFPTLFKSSREPLALAPDSAGSSYVFTLYNKNEKYSLELYDADKSESGPALDFKLSLDNPPAGMKVFPLDGEKHFVIFFFMDFDKPQVFRLNGSKLTQLDREEFRAVNMNLKPGMVTGLRSPSGSRILVCEGKIARLYKWEDTKFVVERQLNPLSESASLVAGYLSDNGTGVQSYLYDESGNYVYHFGSVADKPDRVFFKGGIKDLMGVTLIGSDAHKGLLLVTKSELQLLQEGASAIKLKTIAEYTSVMESPSLWIIFPALLGSPGRNMIGLLDVENRSVELVGYKNEKLYKELAFEVFREASFNSRGSGTSYEPHDIGTGDFNNDHIRDMALLVHDKLIIYFGE